MFRGKSRNDGILKMTCFLLKLILTYGKYFLLEAQLCNNVRGSEKTNVG